MITFLLITIGVLIMVCLYLLSELVFTNKKINALTVILMHKNILTIEDYKSSMEVMCFGKQAEKSSK